MSDIRSACYSHRLLCVYWIWPYFVLIYFDYRIFLILIFWKIGFEACLLHGETNSHLKKKNIRMDRKTGEIIETQKEKESPTLFWDWVSYQLRIKNSNTINIYLMPLYFPSCSPEFSRNLITNSLNGKMRYPNSLCNPSGPGFTLRT